MKAIVFGADGYIGWCLINELDKQGYEVYGFDSFIRRKRVESVTPLEGRELSIEYVDMISYVDVNGILEDIEPDTIVHLAQQPSAAYSMIDYNHCVTTQVTNLLGTLNLLHGIKQYCPEAHLVKLGTMGEYGTPDEMITEDYEGKDPGSWYHASKVHDSVNIKLACKIWGLRATDIMQGIVYGINGYPYTRLDVDECFGTVIHRFCAQKTIDMPLTVYGDGTHKRAILPLVDSIQCLSLLIANPPDAGEYRKVNQFHEIYSIMDIAEFISEDFQFVGNPRKERMNHPYTVESKILPELGYKPSSSIRFEIDKLMAIFKQNKERINPDYMIPRIKWDETNT